MNGERKITAFHEIGHMVEYFVRLMDLFPGDNSRHAEMTKVDSFISPYIGKETSDNEALSMGLESLFEPQIGQEQKIINGKLFIKNMDDEK